MLKLDLGKTLSGFVKRVSKDVRILNITDCDTLRNVAEELKGEDK